MWRPEDQALLDRLEDEETLEALFRYHVGAAMRGRPMPLHPRAAGMIAAARALPGGDTRDVAALARVLEASPMSGKPPALLHHVALYFGKVADELEHVAEEAAARARVHALAAWLALAEEGTYLAKLAQAIAPDASSDHVRMVLDLIGDLGRRAETTSRDLARSGRAALLSLAKIDDAVRLSGVRDPTARSARVAAERGRAAAVDAALSAVGEAFDDASARGDLARSARGILERLLSVWHWSAHDEAVEHYAVEKLSTAGWELYRARQWDALRDLLEPFVPMIEHLASRIERDPGRIAYAAACAQMYVFLSDVASDLDRRIQLAERAVRICPTHRNGRLVLAALLCDRAMASMRTMIVVTRKSELERVEALVARAESLYPSLDEVAEAKAMLERARRLTVL